MADPDKIVPGNIDGDFYVDTTCISCGSCRDLAPTIFQKIPPFYAIVKQPENDEELRQTLDALVCCPVGSVGSREKHDLKTVVNSFPSLLDGEVYYFGFNSPQSAGGKSYFVLHRSGNWMIDSPKFTPRLVNWLKERGGLKYIFLTHRDDVAEADKYATEFGARRIIHREDLDSQRDAEIVLDGYDDTVYDNDFRIIVTPGHTEGHCMLLYRNKYLFSGDVFTSMTRFGDALEVWEPFYCWGDWDEQTRSLEKLSDYQFEWTLPSHGRRLNLPAEKMKLAMGKCIARAKSETDTFPSTPERIAFFERMVPGLEKAGQVEYARKMQNKLDLMRAKIASSSK